jgi:phospholipid/cholesterol/gamma-HCH transport system substrate-binding protein/paraquat-inducible protein B
VRLAAQGLTGTAYLEADYVDPVRNPPLPIDWTPACIYVPSMPSTIRQLSDSVQSLLQKLEDMPLAPLMADVDRLILTLQGLLQDDLRPAIRGLDETVAIMAADVSGLSEALQFAIRNEIIPILENIRTMSAGLPVMVSNVNGTVDKADALLVSQREAIADAVANLRDAAADLKVLTESARQYPAGTLFGDPPARVKPTP